MPAYAINFQPRLGLITHIMLYVSTDAFSKFSHPSVQADSSELAVILLTILGQAFAIQGNAPGTEDQISAPYQCRGTICELVNAVLHYAQSCGRQ